MSHHLIPWQLDASEFDDTWPLGEKIRYWLRYAILAPSAHNNQPWRVELQSNRLDVYLDLRFTPRTGTLRQTAFSIGAFIENYVQAAQHFGYAVEVEKMALHRRREERIATLAVRPLRREDRPIPDLFAGICVRHTNRGIYDPSALPPDFLKELDRLQPERNVRLAVITDPHVKHRLGQIINRSVRIALSLPPLRRELSDFVRYRHEGDDTGLLVEAMIENPPDGESGKAWTLYQMDPEYEAASSQKRFSESPAVFILTSEEEGTRSWIEVGRIMERMFLAGARRGYTHCVSAAAVEIPVFPPLVRRLAALPGRPQVLFRMGQATNPGFTVPSPRRPVQSMIHHD